MLDHALAAFPERFTKSCDKPLSVFQSRQGSVLGNHRSTRDERVVSTQDAAD
jgi:hypothetical protein